MKCTEIWVQIESTLRWRLARHMSVYSDHCCLGGFDADDPTSLPLQVLVLLFTHHLHPDGDGPPRQVETPADQRAAGQAVGAQQHRQQLQPEGKSHMRLRDEAPSRQRKNTWEELT